MKQGDIVYIDSFGPNILWLEEMKLWKGVLMTIKSIAEKDNTATFNEHEWWMCTEGICKLRENDIVITPDGREHIVDQIRGDMITSKEDINIPIRLLRKKEEKRCKTCKHILK